MIPIGAAYLYLDASVEEDTLKKVVLHSVATALASMVLPVPGGPNINTPCNSQDDSMLTLLLGKKHTYCHIPQGSIECQKKRAHNMRYWAFTGEQVVQS